MLIGRISDYIELTKPGIIRGNMVTAAAGFLFAANGNIDWKLLVFALLGTALVIASGCVLNNVADRGIDAKMQRTQQRPLVTRRVPPVAASIFATALGIAGFTILFWYVNLLAVAIGFVGLSFYLLAYGYAKRRTIHSTLIGAVAGATPPVAGYVGVTNSLDTASLLLFLVLLTWQMVHFYAIGIFRREEYRAAGVPILSVKNGVRATKLQIKVYLGLFIISISSLFWLGYTGVVYLAVMTLFAGYWLYLGWAIHPVNDLKWAKKMFVFSLIVLLAFSAVLALNPILP